MLWRGARRFGVLGKTGKKRKNVESRKTLFSEKKKNGLSLSTSSFRDHVSLHPRPGFSLLRRSLLLFLVLDSSRTLSLFFSNLVTRKTLSVVAQKYLSPPPQKKLSPSFPSFSPPSPPHASDKTQSQECALNCLRGVSSAHLACVAKVNYKRVYLI